MVLHPRIRQEELDERLYLGFDASCTTCTGVAQQVQKEVGTELEVIPLTAPRMMRWRRDKLGEDAEWAPTLVRLRGERAVDAWTGWTIAPVLAKHLGPQRSWRVLGALGATRSEARDSASLSRRTLIRGALGAVVGIGILAGTRPRIAAASEQKSHGNDLDPEAISKVNGRELFDTVLAHLHDVDAVNVIEPGSLGAVAAGVESLEELDRSALRAADEHTGQRSAGAVLEVDARRVEHPDGTVQEHVFAYQHDEQLLLISTQSSQPIDGEATRFERLSVALDGAGDAAFTPQARSINGAVPRPLTEADSADDNECNDPCGGCAPVVCHCGDPTNEVLATECDWEWTTNCVLNTIGCAGCAGCSFWWGCLTCAVSSCVSAILACCPSYETVCRGCLTCP